MGTSFSSTKSKRKKSTPYRPPNIRLKDRFDLADNSPFTSQSDASIDKFDYLIVFPPTKGMVSPIRTDETTSDEEVKRVSWQVCQDAWKRCVPGSDERKNKAVEHLSRFWKKRTGMVPKLSDQLLHEAWLTIAREAIIDVLTNDSGLQLKLSASSDSLIFCRVRAPTKLLELQADLENYRLQFRGEIDPGSEKFWNVEQLNKETMQPYAAEIENEKVQYTREEAKKILEDLYKAGKISPHDSTLFPAAENKAIWSTRVHALERIADKVPISNKYCVYTPFSSKPHLRYLFQTYPSVRGRTLFRTKDRLYLTKAVLDTFFELEAFQKIGVVKEILALHDANRGDRLTLDLLQRRWVTIWRPTAAEVGSAMVTNDAYDEEVEAWFYERPFAQPLADIREYFGEEVALYFAWLGHYTVFLLIPAALGAGMLILFQVRGYWYTTDQIDWYMVGFLILLTLWASLYTQSWERECSAIALKWGTRGFEATEKPRTQFTGELQRSTINHRMEVYYPEERRIFATSLNFVIVGFLIVVNAGLIGSVFYADYYVINEYDYWGLTEHIWLLSIVLALLIPLASMASMSISKALNEMENHRTETEYEDNLIKKAMVFDLFNSYGALVFTAFGKSYFFGTCSSSGCINDALILLYSVFIVRALLIIIKMLRRMLSTYYAPSVSLAASRGDRGDSELGGLTEDTDDNHAYMEEVAARKEFEGIFIQYEEAVLQFGYVNLFSVVIPFLALIALFENLLRMRIDAWILCSFERRPHVMIAEDVGTWADLMMLVSILGVVCSAAILCFTERDLEEYSTFEKCIIFLSAEQALLLLKFLVYSLVPPVPTWVSDIVKRNEFITRKFIQGYTDDDQDEDNALEGVDFKSTIDVDGFVLADFRQAKTKIKNAVYTEIEKKQSQRRDLMRSLREAKDRLQRTYQVESFNVHTGVGENKQGLPLGRLTVKIISLNMLSEDCPADYHKVVKIRLQVRSCRQGVIAGPSLSSKSHSKPIELTRGNMTLNQNMGPYAPIRTSDAEVLFEIIDEDDELDKPLARTVVHLQELSDQEPRNMILTLSVDSKEAVIADPATLSVTMHFQFSKILPMRKAIFNIQESLKEIEKELAKLMVEEQHS